MHTLFIPLPTTTRSLSRARHLQQLFDDVVRQRDAHEFVPAADTSEDAHGFTIELDVPGASATDINVVAEAGTLTVSGTAAVRQPREGERTVSRERRSGSFSRQFRLPESADSTRVAATHQNGVLTVRIEKIAREAPRRVPVQSFGAPIEQHNATA